MDHVVTRIVAERYSARQVFIIREAIAAGRAAMAEYGAEPLVFAGAFLDVDGAQVPGGELDAALRSRVNGQVLEALGGTPDGSAGPQWLHLLIGREVRRIRAEVEMFRARANPDVVGFRFRHAEDVAELAFCRSLAGHDLYGLGPGIIPRREIVVLPPGCDRVWWEPVCRPGREAGPGPSQAASSQ